ncbi:hypothetical protein H2201_003740 [Coniosporium apollinis]|uniref:F-box domain-containing protein n=2 Tax=Coniosporium TaxID=2810619 RepID=A0ABQ9NUI9_9PEZI|nr:hypothetical protein H2199_005082 [Cladosporium sp. JES 115]KAJ9666062.1 hypothetical protein H2201_003740 [Coniosporium apollinis]
MALPSKPFRLLDLPKELRDNIYEVTLRTDYHRHSSFCTFAQGPIPANHISINILCVSRQVYNEARSRLLAVNTFHFRSSRQGRDLRTLTNSLSTHVGIPCDPSILSATLYLESDRDQGYAAFSFHLFTVALVKCVFSGLSIRNLKIQLIKEFEFIDPLGQPDSTALYNLGRALENIHDVQTVEIVNMARWVKQADIEALCTAALRPSLALLPLEINEMEETLRIARLNISENHERLQSLSSRPAIITESNPWLHTLRLTRPAFVDFSDPRRGPRIIEEEAGTSASRSPAEVLAQRNQQILDEMRLRPMSTFDSRQVFPDQEAGGLRCVV